MPPKLNKTTVERVITQPQIGDRIQYGLGGDVLGKISSESYSVEGKEYRVFYLDPTTSTFADLNAINGRYRDEKKRKSEEKEENERKKAAAKKKKEEDDAKEAKDKEERKKARRLASEKAGPSRDHARDIDGRVYGMGNALETPVTPVYSKAAYDLMRNITPEMMAYLANAAATASTSVPTTSTAVPATPTVTATDTTVATDSTPGNGDENGEDKTDGTTDPTVAATDQTDGEDKQ